MLSRNIEITLFIYRTKLFVVEDKNIFYYLNTQILKLLAIFFVTLRLIVKGFSAVTEKV